MLSDLVNGFNKHDFAYLPIAKAKKLKGRLSGLYRIRKGKYRIVFSVIESSRTIKGVHVGKIENICS